MTEQEGGRVVSAMLCLISLTIFYRVKVNKQNTFNYQLSIVNYQFFNVIKKTPPRNDTTLNDILLQKKSCRNLSVGQPRVVG